MKSINPEKTSQLLVNFLKETFKKAKFSRAIIALSGGIDSSLSCTLAVEALGRDKVFPIILPYGKLNEQGTRDALEIIEKLKIPKNHITQINIETYVDEIVRNDPKMDMVRKGNIMARIRMIFVFDQAKRRKALVIGTENKSEHLLGYFTMFGDEASDIEPLRNLYKTHVCQLAEFLRLPQSILTKKPTAGLWEDQTDEGEFGFSYKNADKVLYYYFDRKLTAEEIAQKSIKKATVDKVLRFAKKNDFKHKLPLIANF